VRSRTFVIAVSLILGAAAVAQVPVRHFEGSLWGFPTLTDPSGRPVAEGRLVQWNDAEGLHTRGVFDFPDGRRLEEESVLAQREGDLRQLTWSWELQSGGEVLERYAVDFQSGQVEALKMTDGERKEWSKTMELTPGKTFAGVGFLYAVKNLRQRLMDGEQVELEAVGFLPRPQKARVSIRHDGDETLVMGGRSLPANHFVIHPEVPRIARLFVDAPDNHLWLYDASPPAFLRSEGPMMGLGTLRIDVLPPME